MQLHDSAIASLGYQRLLSIVQQTCNDQWQLFADLQRFNPYTNDMRERLEEAISGVAARLEAIEGGSCRGSNRAGKATRRT